MHAVIDRQRNHGIHFRVLAKTLRMSGGDHLHSGTVVGKLEGEREVTLGFVDLMRDAYIVAIRNIKMKYNLYCREVRLVEHVWISILLGFR